MPEGATVVFSAHGVAPVGARRGRGARACKTIDATCPLVTKVHHEAERFADDDYDILLIGHEGHEEVVGTAGEAPEHITLVDGPDDVDDDRRSRDPEKVVWLSQTTLSVDETMRDRRPRCASGSRCCSTRRATTSATPPRTARSRSRRSPSAATWSSSSARQLVELGAAGRGGARGRRRRRVPRRQRHRDRRGLARRRDDGRRSPAARRCPRSSSRRAGLARRARLRRRRGGLDRGGALHLRAAAGAAARPEGRGRPAAAEPERSGPARDVGRARSPDTRRWCRGSRAR